MSGLSEPSSSRPRGYGTSASTSASRSKGKLRETVIDIADNSDQDQPASHLINGNSDKKGKGKARDETAAAPAGLSVNVRFTDGTTEDLVDLFVNDSETVRLVKRRVRHDLT